MAGAVAHHLGRDVGSHVQRRNRVILEATRGIVDGEPTFNASRLLHFGGFHRNLQDVTVPAVGTATSVINVTGQADAGSAVGGQLRVSYRMFHASRGRMQVDLIAPGGQTFRLHAPSGDTGDDLNVVDLGVPASQAQPNGSWTLRVIDSGTGTGGHIEDWSLQF